MRETLNSDDPLVVYAMREVPPSSLVNRLAGQTFKRIKKRVPLEDLKGEGFLGYLDGLLRADPSMLKTLASYLAIRTEGAIIDFLRREDVLSRTARKSDTGAATFEPFEDERHKGHYLKEDEILDAIDTERKLQQIKMALLQARPSPRDLDIFLRSFEGAEFLDDIVKPHGISQPRGTQIIQALTSKVRKSIFPRGAKTRREC